MALRVRTVLGGILALALLSSALPSTAFAQTRPQPRPSEQSEAPSAPQTEGSEGENGPVELIAEWMSVRPHPRPKEGETPATPSPNRDPNEEILGPETNLPLPRFVSLKSNEVNARRGPSLTHRVDWVFTREDLPVMITAEYGHWRRIVDREGQGGWVHYALLSGNRTVIIEEPEMPVLAQPEPNAPLRAKFDLGVIAELGECRPDWCRLRAGGITGWANKKNFWGIDPDEIRE